MIGVSFTCWPTRGVRQTVPRVVSHEYWRLIQIHKGERHSFRVLLAEKVVEVTVVYRRCVGVGGRKTAIAGLVEIDRRIWSQSFGERNRKIRETVKVLALSQSKAWHDVAAGINTSGIPCVLTTFPRLHALTDPLRNGAPPHRLRSTSQLAALNTTIAASITRYCPIFCCDFFVLRPTSL
jgi:hypothetical protein